MNSIAPIVDFDDPTFDPLHVDEAAFGDIADIYSILGPLQAKSSVHFCEFGELLGGAGDPNYPGAKQFTVLGYRDVLAVNNDAETFSIDSNEASIGRTMGRTLSLLNPPEHTRIRRVFQRAFLPHVVAQWGDDLVAPVVNSLIDKFIARGGAELVEEFTMQYPFQIIYRQLALPERDIKIFHKLSVTMLQTYGDFIRYGLEASRKLGSYFKEMIEQRRKNPGNDLVTLLVEAEVEGERIPEETTIAFLRQLIAAAGDTTYRSTSALLIGLLRNPDQLQQVRSDRKLLPLAIEEALRWDGPTTLNHRMAMRDTSIAGVEIPKGSIVYSSHWTANRDPKIFTDPACFNIHRKRERHVAFGYGAHLCLGQHLARLEMTRAINAILDRLPNLRLDPSKPEPEIRGVYMRTPRNIHVLFG
jgi:cytochrome P450